MAGVILRTAAGTLLFIAFLWLVRIDDYRVAGMMLTFPMLNGIGLVGAGANAERLTKAMMPVIILNGVLCVLFVLALVSSEVARQHPVALTALAVTGWLAAYGTLEARNLAFASNRSMMAFLAGCAVAAAAITYWLWPSCVRIAGETVVRPGGLSGVLESWLTIALFAASLAVLFGFAYAYPHAHAAIGRLAALPLVPLFGLYTVASATAADPAGLPKLEMLQSMIPVGWVFAVLFAVALSRYVMHTATAPSSMPKRIVALIGGWALCLGCIVASAKIAAFPCIVQ